MLAVYNFLRALLVRFVKFSEFTQKKRFGGYSKNFEIFMVFSHIFDRSFRFSVHFDRI